MNAKNGNNAVLTEQTNVNLIFYTHPAIDTKEVVS